MLFWCWPLLLILLKQCYRLETLTWRYEINNIVIAAFNSIERCKTCSQYTEHSYNINKNYTCTINPTIQLLQFTSHCYKCCQTVSDQHYRFLQHMVHFKVCPCFVFEGGWGLEDGGWGVGGRTFIESQKLEHTWTNSYIQNWYSSSAIIHRHDR